MNIFRILADVCHTASKCILIWAIHRNKSSEGVSLLTQLLYVVVFLARYLDLFWVPPYYSWWNFILKNFYIWSSLYIIFIMLRVFARTREKEKSWKLGAYALVGSMIAAPIVGFTIGIGNVKHTFSDFVWVFSIVLESVCVLPQLLLLRQTSVPTVIDSGYLITLGSYRAFYILNWVYRMFTQNKPNPVSVVFGIVQTALYIDFAWVYYTRQRVKLRGGGVVDSDDLRKGFLVHRALQHGGGNRESLEDPEAQDREEPSRGQTNAPGTNRWGARGISISADDTLHDHHKPKGRSAASGESSESDAMLQDPDDFLDDHDDDAPALDSPGSKVLNSDSEWRDRESDGK